MRGLPGTPGSVPPSKGTRLRDLGTSEGTTRILGDGWRFVEDPSWNLTNLPVALGWVSTAASDAAGRLLIFQRNSPQLVVLEGDGTFADSNELEAVEDAHGITVAPDGSVLLVDRDGQQVLRLLDDGSTERLMDGSRFGYPTAVAVDPESGDFFVTDGYGNAQVHRFDASGEHILSWGSHGTAPGEFNLVHAIAFDPAGRVFVADRENGRVQIFDQDGESLAVWDGYYRPLGLYIDAIRGLVFVSEGSTRITVRDLEGTLVAVGRAPDIAHGLSGDAEGALYLTSPALKTVIKLRLVEGPERRP